MPHTVEVFETRRRSTKAAWRNAATRAHLRAGWPDTEPNRQIAEGPSSGLLVLTHEIEGTGWKTTSSRPGGPDPVNRATAVEVQVARGSIRLALKPPPHTVPQRRSFDLGPLEREHATLIAINWKSTARRSGGDWVYSDIETLVRLRDDLEDDRSLNQLLASARLVDLRAILF